MKLRSVRSARPIRRKDPFSAVLSVRRSRAEEAADLAAIVESIRRQAVDAGLLSPDSPIAASDVLPILRRLYAEAMPVPCRVAASKSPNAVRLQSSSKRRRIARWPAPCARR
jgi:hypothetical protein